MGLFGKIKEILFDEETVEIPVITKEEQTKEKEVKEKSKSRENVNKTKRANDEEVIIRKIETPKRATSLSDDLFDMPKFKEEVKEEKKANSFTFPVFNDNEELTDYSEKRTKRSSKSYSQDALIEDIPKRSNNKETTPKHERTTGYNTAYDYSYGKYKGDYKSSRESNQTVLEKTLQTKEEHTGFTPSPIISPVYGVLNENYKKEDIVSKREAYKNNSNALDLDSVRRKAYGTLEDDIEDSLNRENLEVEENYDEELLEEDGISIDDLLVDSQADDVLDEINDETSEIELFDVTNKSGDEDNASADNTELLDEEDDLPSAVTLSEAEEINLDDEEENPIIVVNDDEVKGAREKRVPKASVVEEVEDKKESVGDEDLFDLIDSLYDGKGEE